MAFSVSRAGREAIAEAAAHRVTSLLLVLVTLAMTTATLLTVGRTAATEKEILANIDAAGTRLITMIVRDPHPGILAEQVELMAQLPHAAWAFGLGRARDTKVGATEARANVAARELVNTPPDLVEITEGRSPRPGEAVVSAKAGLQLRLLDPAGSVWVGSEDHPVVGGYSSAGVLEELDRLVLVAPAPNTDPRATLVYVLADDASNVAAVADQATKLTGLDTDGLTIRTSDQLVAVHDVLSGQIGGFARQLAVGVLALGLVLVLLTVSLALSSRRADMGRRRALGSSRSALTALLLLAVGLPTVIGTGLGVAVGLGGLSLSGSSPPAPAFTLSVCWLVVMSAVAATVVPVIRAAWSDPVTILRVP